MSSRGCECTKSLSKPRSKKKKKKTQRMANLRVQKKKKKDTKNGQHSCPKKQQQTKDTKNGQHLFAPQSEHLCPKTLAQEHKEWRSFVSKNSRSRTQRMANICLRPSLCRAAPVLKTALRGNLLVRKEKLSKPLLRDTRKNRYLGQHQLAYQQVPTPQNALSTNLPISRSTPPKTALSYNLPISRSTSPKSPLKNAKNGQYLCPKMVAQEHKEWPIFMSKNGQPNFSIEPGPGHPLAVACVSSLQPLAASEANTHTQVFLYDRRCYDIVYLRYGAHIGTLALRLGAVAMLLCTFDTAVIQEHLLFISNYARE